jgi:hypothetical protein
MVFFLLLTHLLLKLVDPEMIEIAHHIGLLVNLTVVQLNDLQC